MVTSYGQLQEWFPDEETTFYFIHITIVKITDADFKSFDGIKIQYDFIMLEGKVLVEEFNTDPSFNHYFFRHSNISNPLKGQ